MAECDAPGASVAKVVMAHGISANVVHRWRQLARESGSSVSACTSEFVPVSLAAEPAAAPALPADIQIQLRRGTTAMVIARPVSASADFAAWTRDNNWVENQIRPIALGRSNWLFAGSLRAGRRAAAIMSLVHSARLNGHEPHAHLKDVLERLPTQPASRVQDLLPHRWQPGSAVT